MRAVGMAALACTACGTFGAAAVPDDAGGSPTTLDGGGSADGGGVATDGGTTSGFCSNRPSSVVFCETFDDLSDPKKPFDDAFITSGGNAALDPSLFVTPSKSLRTKLAETIDVTSTESRFERVLDRTSWPKARFEMSVYFRKASWENTHTNTAIGSLTYSTATGGPVLYAFLVVGPNTFGIGVTFQSTYLGTPPASVPLPVDTWVRVVVEIDRVGSGLPVRVFFDDARVLENVYPITTTPAIAKVHASIGIDNINPPAPAFDVNYDNVVLELE